MIKFDTIGSDPEFLIQKDGEFVPSFLFIRGTKKQPEDVGNGFAVLKDNLLVEGNIPPAKSKDEFVGYMVLLKELLNNILEPADAKLVSDDIASYKDEYIFTEDGLEFGCSNYRNPYKRAIVQTPQLFTHSRPAGFHIHIGYTILDNTYKKRKIDELIAKAFDYFVTLPSDKIYFTKERRENYGEYGSYRPTSYGVECRSLGGYFTQDLFLEWIYNQTVKTVEFVSNPENHKKLDAINMASEDNYDILGIKLEEQLPSLIKQLV